jgi:hypothetical protein
MLLIVSNETDCCSARVSLSDNAILNMNTVESQLSNLWLSIVPFYPPYVIRTLFFTFINIHFPFVLSVVNSEWYKLYSPSCLCILTLIVCVMYILFLLFSYMLCYVMFLMMEDRIKQ